MSKGYASVTHGGTTFAAHRLVLEWARGEAIPPGHTVDHRCRVKRCVNPAHLEVVTVAEHTRRMHDAYRATRERDRRRRAQAAAMHGGPRPGTIERVARIRELREAGLSTRAVGASLGLSGTAVLELANRHLGGW